MTTRYITRQDLRQAEEHTKRKWKTLLILLVLALRTGTKAPAKAAPITVGKPEKPVPQVLLIDTDPASSKELATVLEIGGFRVVTALDYQQILQMMEEADLVILDEEMSRSDELCSRIREQWNAPIILLGSDPRGKGWERAVAMGADAYLAKSIDREELVARIRAILRRYLNIKH